MTSRKTNRRQFNKEFKVEAVELLLSSSKKGVEIARDLGIRTELLYRWKSEYLSDKEFSFPGSGKLSDEPEQKELRELEKKYRELEEERDILKKALAIFSKRTQ